MGFFVLGIVFGGFWFVMIFYFGYNLGVDGEGDWNVCIVIFDR